MSTAHSRSVQQLTQPIVIVDEAHRTLSHLDHVLRTGALTAPAEAYQVVGSMGRVADSLQHCLEGLSWWWQQQDAAGGMAVADGPFANDPAAAVAVAVQSLEAATQSCSELLAGLERAQICTAELAPSDEPTSVRQRRRTHRRR